MERPENLNDKGSGKTVLTNYATLNLALKSEKFPTTDAGNMRLNLIGSVLDTLDIWYQEMISKQLLKMC